MPGRLVVLTSPWTFSAAISTLGYLKQAVPERVRIVGEPVGDRLQFFAEGRPLLLKHSGVAALMATERHDYEGGCRAFADCHALVHKRPIAVDSLHPDVPVVWRFADYPRRPRPGHGGGRAAVATLRVAQRLAIRPSRTARAGAPARRFWPAAPARS